jgi:hypothetical protein
MTRRLGTGVCVALLATVLALAGCTQTVPGRGAAAGPTVASSAPPSSAPAPRPSPPAPPTCPHVRDTTARLSYDCIASVMTRDSDTIWPLKFATTVDVDWTMDEGSSHVAVTGNGNVTILANGFASAMGAQEYGPGPTVKRVRDTDANVDGHRAHLVESLITIAPAYRKKRHIKLTQERLWVVVVQIGAGQFSAWYVSIPDVRKPLWSKVPGLIKRIKVV